MQFALDLFLLMVAFSVLESSGSLSTSVESLSTDHATTPFERQGLVSLGLGGWDLRACWASAIGWEVGISGIPTVQHLENKSSPIEKALFRKLWALKHDAELYRGNILGPNFQKYILFQFKDLEHLS